MRRWHWLQHLESGISQYNFGLLDQDVFNYVGWLHPEFIQVNDGDATARKPAQRLAMLRYFIAGCPEHVTTHTW